MPTTQSKSQSSVAPNSEELGQPHSKRNCATSLQVACLVTAVALLLAYSFQLEHTSDDDTLRILVSSTQSYHSRRRTKKKDCLDGKYTRTTVQLIQEMPFAALFKDLKGQQKFEASSVTVVDDDAYAVCDSSWAISRFESYFRPYAPGNVQIGEPNREPEEESNYEAIFHDNGVFYVVRESVGFTETGRRRARASYHAIIEELSLTENNDYKMIAACPTEFEFEGVSKGFEGAEAVRDLKNELVVLGLCEGNYCSEDTMDDTGNGRLIAMKRVTPEDGSCIWSTIREIELPDSADFRDYSDISIDENGRVAITSQEDSRVWIGHMLGKNEDGLWDIDKLEFDDEHKLYDFPRNDACKKIYCNIEGIHWMGENMLLAVSDRMKSKGEQHFRCFGKDQSVHQFLIPP